jgi:hypothetical protein
MIVPILVGQPFMYAFLLPFGLIWISMLIFAIQGTLWRNSFLSLAQFKGHINQIRGVNAVTTVGGQGQLSIDQCSWD